jgi:hypothetical protein
VQRHEWGMREEGRKEGRRDMVKLIDKANE